MKLLALFLAGCAVEVVPVPSPCSPPSFTDAACFSPGGGVTRCPEADGTYWDRQPSGAAVHWRGTGTPNEATIICEVRP